MLLRFTRGDDIACRYGGEEFTLILSEASLEAARQRAELLRTEVKALATRGGAAIRTAVTLSCGVAQFPEHGASAEDLLHAADRALYAAKSSGRDRVAVAEPRSKSEGA